MPYHTSDGISKTDSKVKAGRLTLCGVECEGLLLISSWITFTDALMCLHVIMMLHIL